MSLRPRVTHPLARRLALVLGVVLLAIWLLPVRQMTPLAPVPSLSYSAFRAHLAADHLAQVDLRPSGVLLATFKPGVTPLASGHATRFSTLLPAPPGDRLLADLEAHHVTIQELPAPDSTTFGASDWTSVLTTLLLVGAMFWMSRVIRTQRESVTKGIAPLVAETPAVTFADVAGCDEAKDDLEETVYLLKHPQRMLALGGHAPRGALLVGPPGTGKTLLARAVAGEAGCPFFSISGSEFVEMFVGVGAARVRSLFAQAASMAPCVVFIDEIDALGRARGTGHGQGNDEREQTLNQLLVAMDGFSPSAGIVVLAATNRPDVLDPALCRPGRFDRQVTVDLPDIKGRRAILAVHTTRTPLAADVDLDRIARGTPGLSGAELANTVNEATLIAARRAAERVTQGDFLDALDRVMMGKARTTLVLSPAERELTAVHEAGHAVVALRTPILDPVHKLSIMPRGQALGVTLSIPEADRHSHSQAWLEAQLVMLFGGRAAELERFGPGAVTTGASDDIRRATRIAHGMVAQFGMSPDVGPMAVGPDDLAASPATQALVDAEIRRFLVEAMARAVVLVRQEAPLVAALTAALLEHETLDRDALQRVVSTVAVATSQRPGAVGVAA